MLFLVLFELRTFLVNYIYLTAKVFLDRIVVLNLFLELIHLLVDGQLFLFDPVLGFAQAAISFQYFLIVFCL